METYRGHARPFLRYVFDVHGELDVGSLTDDDVVGFLAAAKAKGDASTTRTTKLMSVRSFGAWMVDAGRHPGPILGQAVKPPHSTTAPRPGKHLPLRRHTYAPEMRRMGFDVTVLQRQLGHSKITTPPLTSRPTWPL